MSEEKIMGIVNSMKFTRLKDLPPAEARTRVTLFQPADMENASLLTKANRLRKELSSWAKAGLPLVSSAIRKARIATCEKCPGGYYDPAGNWGMGQCKAPGCGCSRVKAALATSVCPKGYWTGPASTQPQNPPQG